MEVRPSGASRILNPRAQSPGGAGKSAARICPLEALTKKASEEIEVGTGGGVLPEDAPAVADGAGPGGGGENLPVATTTHTCAGTGAPLAGWRSDDTCEYGKSLALYETLPAGCQACSTAAVAVAMAAALDTEGLAVATGAGGTGLCFTGCAPHPAASSPPRQTTTNIHPALSVPVRKAAVKGMAADLELADSDRLLVEKSIP